MTPQQLPIIWNRRFVYPCEIAQSLQMLADRWQKINQDDEALLPLRVAVNTIRALETLVEGANTNIRKGNATLDQQERNAKFRNASSSVEIEALKSKIEALEREVTNLRAENAALAAVAARPTVEIKPTLEATLRQSDSRTSHRRDADGELVESVTTYESE